MHINTAHDVSTYLSSDALTISVDRAFGVGCYWAYVLRRAAWNDFLQVNLCYIMLCGLAGIVCHCWYCVVLFGVQRHASCIKQKTRPPSPITTVDTLDNTHHTPHTRPQPPPPITHAPPPPPPIRLRVINSCHTEHGTWHCCPTSIMHVSCIPLTNTPQPHLMTTHLMTTHILTPPRIHKQQEQQNHHQQQQ